MAKQAPSVGIQGKPTDGNGKGKPPNKLSSGILGMKFMQQEATETGESAEASGEASSESAKPSETRSQHGYYPEEDPGQWFSPGVPTSTARAPSLNKTSPSIGYADIYGKGSDLGGRRSYGAKPKRVDPEEMVKHYGDSEKRSKKAERAKQPSRKRLSSEHTEATRSDSRSKQRRRS